jgi:ribonuclease VapC
MILDSSAIIAVMTREAAVDELVAKMAGATLAVGAPTLAETSLVLSARARRDVQGLVARFLGEFDVETVAFGQPHWQVASEAFYRFGKGRHPAGLNFGDCMAYAVAKVAEQPLLYVGNDFGQTDIQPA